MCPHADSGRPPADFATIQPIPAGVHILRTTMGFLEEFGGSDGLP
jgi:hypothetical protein